MSAIYFSVQMRFGDEDSFGHVNNVTMLRYFEDCRVRLSSQPIPDDAPEHLQGPSLRESWGDFRTVVAHQSVDYKAQLHYRMEPVCVKTWVSRIGGSSFTVSYSLQEEDGSVVYATSESILVLADIQTGKSQKLTERQKGVLELFGEQGETK